MTWREEDHPRDRHGRFATLARQQGFGLPRVGDLDSAISRGGVELWRGTSNQAAARKFRESIDPEYGQGDKGSGFYATTDRAEAERYGGTGGTLTRMVLQPGARMIDWDVLAAEHSASRSTESDMGAYAISRGYDAVHYTGAQPDVATPDIEDLDDLDPGDWEAIAPSPADEYIVLNRSVILVEGNDGWARRIEQRLRQ